jgi:hypothetical protein
MLRRCLGNSTLTTGCSAALALINWARRAQRRVGAVAVLDGGSLLDGAEPDRFTASYRATLISHPAEPRP